MDDDLIIAARYGHVRSARLLVLDGANAEAVDDRGMTSLHWACSLGHLDLVEYLVEEAGVDVENLENQDREGGRDMEISVFSFYLGIVKYFVEQRQANVDVKDGLGRTPLDEAVRLDKGDNLIRYLLPRTSSFSEVTLCGLWECSCFSDIRPVVLERYAIGLGLAGAFRRHPIHTLFWDIPLPSAKAFKEAIELFPSSVLSAPDKQGRLSIHVALTIPEPGASKSPLVVGFIFEREHRLALARDPTNGLYPHEMAAGLISDCDCNDDESRWLDIVYKMFRSNPQHLLGSRTRLQTIDGPSPAKRPKMEC